MMKENKYQQFINVKRINNTIYNCIEKESRDSVMELLKRTYKESRRITYWII